VEGAVSRAQHFAIADGGGLVLVDEEPDDTWREMSSVTHRRTVPDSRADSATAYEVAFRVWEKGAQRLASFAENCEHVGGRCEPFAVTITHNIVDPVPETEVDG
jgi:hypothetical protein